MYIVLNKLMYQLKSIMNNKKWKDRKWRYYLGFQHMMYQTKKLKSVSIIIYIIYAISSLSICYGDVGWSTKPWVSFMCIENLKKYLNLIFIYFELVITLRIFNVNCDIWINSSNNNSPIHIECNFLGNK